MRGEDPLPGRHRELSARGESSRTRELQTERGVRREDREATGSRGLSEWREGVEIAVAELEIVGSWLTFGDDRELRPTRGT